MPSWHNRRVDPIDVPKDAGQGRKSGRAAKKTDRVTARKPQMDRKPFEKGTGQDE